jgi:hypothetical protein
MKMKDDPIADRDDDLIIGRKGILHFLQLSDWQAVVSRIKNENLPVQKISGRLEMSKEKYQAWRDERMNVPTKSGVPVKTENKGEGHKSILRVEDIDIIREGARKVLLAAIEHEVNVRIDEIKGTNKGMESTIKASEEKPDRPE